MLDMRAVAAHARDERTPAMDSSRKTSGRFAPLSIETDRSLRRVSTMFQGLSWQANGLWIDAEVG